MTKGKGSQKPINFPEKGKCSDVEKFNMENLFFFGCSQPAAVCELTNDISQTLDISISLAARSHISVILFIKSGFVCSILLRMRKLKISLLG